MAIPHVDNLSVACVPHFLQYDTLRFTLCPTRVRGPRCTLPVDVRGLSIPSPVEAHRLAAGLSLCTVLPRFSSTPKDAANGLGFPLFPQDGDDTNLLHTYPPLRALTPPLPVKVIALDYRSFTAKRLCWHNTKRQAAFPM